MIGTLPRREYKYLIDEEIADRVRRAISGICEADRHAAASGGRYVCDTLYLDTLAMHIYRATIENEQVRYKLRIRTYPGTDSPVFLEVKRRVDEVIVKTRAAVRGDWVGLLETGKIELASFKDREAIENFLAYYQACRGGPMMPVVLVRYEREPYTSLLDDYARVTFDRKLRYQPKVELSVVPDHAHWSPIDDPVAMRGAPFRSAVVLELKFTNNVPSWMRRIVQALELSRLSFCKYTRSVDSMLHRPAPRVPLV